MQFVDQRQPVVWAVGDMVVTDSTNRFIIIQIDDLGGFQNYVSMLSTATSITVMTRPDLATLQNDFTELYTVTEVIKSGDLQIVAIND